MMRRWACSVAFVLLGTAWASAEEVSVTFTLPPDYAELMVSWSATPLDLPPDADILNAMVMEPEALAGPWQVDLEPGQYQVSAFSDSALFELVVTIVAGTAQAYEVPTLDVAMGIPFRCPEEETCAFTDETTGLSFVIPKGWAAEAPSYYDLGDGRTATDISAVFFEDTDGEGAAVWFLNPVEWIDAENGPCRLVELGNMCTFDSSESAERAFGIIAPSLKLTPPR